MQARSVDRVVSHTDPGVNQRIRRQTEMSLYYYRAHPEQIDQRLRELDMEWDMERAVEAIASGLSLMGFTWGMFRRRWWLIGLAAQGLFAQHALQGWCAGMGVVRRLGFRTAQEIEAERHQLLALSGKYPQHEAATEPPRDPLGASAFQPA